MSITSLLKRFKTKPPTVMVTSIVIILDKNIDINNKIKFKSEIISEFEEMIDGKSKIRRYSCINKW